MTVDITCCQHNMVTQITSYKSASQTSYKYYTSCTVHVIHQSLGARPLKTTMSVAPVHFVTRVIISPLPLQKIDPARTQFWRKWHVHQEKFYRPSTISKYAVHKAMYEIQISKSCVCVYCKCVCRRTIFSSMFEVTLTLLETQSWWRKTVSSFHQLLAK